MTHGLDTSVVVRIISGLPEGEYATAGNDTYSCEKSFRRLAGTVVISG